MHMDDIGDIRLRGVGFPNLCKIVLYNFSNSSSSSVGENGFCGKKWAISWEELGAGVSIISKIFQELRMLSCRVFQICTFVTKNKSIAVRIPPGRI